MRRTKILKNIETLKTWGKNWKKFFLSRQHWFFTHNKILLDISSKVNTVLESTRKTLHFDTHIGHIDLGMFLHYFGNFEHIWCILEDFWSIKYAHILFFIKHIICLFLVIKSINGQLKGMMDESVRQQTLWGIISKENPLKKWTKTDHLTDPFHHFPVMEILADPSFVRLLQEIFQSVWLIDDWSYLAKALA